MSIRQSLLTILNQGPGYGYQLRTEFERRTGGTWPLNIGQVYSTLERLERDGLVEQTEVGDEGHRYFEITDSGRGVVDDWLRHPVSRTGAMRDELAIKLALAVTLPGVDVPDIIQTQRTGTLRALQDLTRMKMAANDPTSADDLAWSLVLESLIFSVEAEVRWLDHIESVLVRARKRADLQPRPISAEPARRGRPIGVDAASHEGEAGR